MQTYVAPQTPTCLDAALICASAGIPVIRIYPDTKRPRGNAWQEKATTDPRIIRRWWGPGSRDDTDRNRIEYGVGAVLKRASLLAIDPDSPEALAALAALEAQEPDAADTWTIHSPNGKKRVYTAPGGLTLPNGSAWVRVQELGGADLLTGSMIVAMPDGSRSWEGSPEELVARSPRYLLDYLEARTQREAGEEAEREQRRQEAVARMAQLSAGEREQELTRLQAYALATAQSVTGELASMASASGRGVALYSASIRLARLHAAGWLDESLARGLLEDAAQVSGLVSEDGQRRAFDHIARGWEKGLDLGPAAPPEDRSLPTVQNAEEGLVHMQTIMGLIGGGWASWCEDGISHPTARESAERIGTAILRRSLGSRSWSIASGMESLAEEVGCGGGTVARFADRIQDAPGCPIKVHRGGVDAKGKITATRWTIDKALATGLSEYCPMVESVVTLDATAGNTPAGERPANTLSRIGHYSTPLYRGMRNPRQTGVSEPSTFSVGPKGQRIAAALQEAQGPLSLDECIDEGSCSRSTAQVNLDKLMRLGLVTAERVRTGKRGMPPLVYRWVGVVTKAARAVVRRGREIIKRAEARRDAWREEAALAHSLAKRLGIPWAVALGMVRFSGKARAAAERALAAGERPTDKAERADAIGRTRAGARAHVRGQARWRETLANRASALVPWMPDTPTDAELAQAWIDPRAGAKSRLAQAFV